MQVFSKQNKTKPTTPRFVRYQPILIANIHCTIVLYIPCQRSLSNREGVKNCHLKCTVTEK